MVLPAEVRRAIRPDKSALVLVDLQRRHMDPEVGYHLVDAKKAEELLGHVGIALDAAREKGVPVVHVQTYSRKPSPWGAIDHANPFWNYQTGRIIPGMNRPRQSGKNVEGSPYAEPMPAVAPVGTEPVIVKRRYSAFYQTDLELALRGLGVETIFVAGVNTNNCVLATIYDAFSRDFRIVLLEDCCGSMNGEEYHRFAVMEVEAALGFIADSREFAELVFDYGPESA